MPQSAVASSRLQSFSSRSRLLNTSSIVMSRARSIRSCAEGMELGRGRTESMISREPELMVPMRLRRMATASASGQWWRTIRNRYTSEPCTDCGLKSRAPETKCGTQYTPAAEQPLLSHYSCFRGGLGRRKSSPEKSVLRAMLDAPDDPPTYT